jgi:hypothetical protein
MNHKRFQRFKPCRKRACSADGANCGQFKVFPVPYVLWPAYRPGYRFSRFPIPLSDSHFPLALPLVT